MRGIVILFLVILTLSHRAVADTICPSVSNNVEILSVSVTGSPEPGQGYYDPTTGGLLFQPTAVGNRAQYFIGVPSNLVIGHQYMPWVTLNSYPQAVMQEQSTCPLLEANNQPLPMGGSMFPTVSPFVQSSCAAISDNTEIIELSLINPPFSVYLATYDRKTQFIDIQWASGDSALFVDVPASVIGTTGVVQWSALASYQQSLMLEPGACPLVLQGSSG